MVVCVPFSSSHILIRFFALHSILIPFLFSYSDIDATYLLPCNCRKRDTQIPPCVMHAFCIYAIFANFFYCEKSLLLSVFSLCYTFFRPSKLPTRMERGKLLWVSIRQTTRTPQGLFRSYFNPSDLETYKRVIGKHCRPISDAT